MNQPSIEKLVTICREAVSQTLKEGIETAKDWPQARDRMRIADSLATKLEAALRVQPASENCPSCERIHEEWRKRCLILMGDADKLKQELKKCYELISYWHGQAERAGVQPPSASEQEGFSYLHKKTGKARCVATNPVPVAPSEPISDDLERDVIYKQIKEFLWKTYPGNWNDARVVDFTIWRAANPVPVAPTAETSKPTEEL